MKALLLACAIVLSAGIIAHAAADEIHGCIKARGVLTVKATCAQNERELTWNQQGPQGPAGAPAASTFVMVTGSARSEDPGSQVVSCPEGLSVLGASVYTEDDWGTKLYNLPVEIADEGGFSHSIVADWRLWFEDSSTAYWNVTCGAV